MNRFKLIISGVILSCSLVAHAATETADKPQSMSMDTLLERVKQGHHQDQQDNEQRIARFSQNKAEQQTLLTQTTNDRVAAEKLSYKKEQEFEQNEQQITLLKQRLTERLGSLKELFGVLQLVANDAQGQFDNSLVQIHYPQRSAKLNAFADKMGQTTELPKIEEIEALWFELQREMVDSGKVTTSTQTVLSADGTEQQLDVTRVGTFNLIADGKYLQRINETGRLVEFAKQPSSRYMTGADQISTNDGQLIPFTIDPIRGQLIALKGTAPDLSERIQQGGEIGFIIIILGVLVIFIALARLLYLVVLDSKIQTQLNELSTPADNPLGRILKVYQSSKTDDVESLELKLGEAVLREVPKINWGLSFLKISAAIAPLMGLLGTVTGMIVTFQAITLFGAGDPKLMAGGISQALVTTVLGLVVAIPTLLLHNLVQGKATKINEVLEQEAIALVALSAEQEQAS